MGIIVEEQKIIINEIVKRKEYEVERHKEINFFEKHKSFEGTPQKDPNDNQKVILVNDPFTDGEIYYEFPITSVAYVEEIGTFTSEEGKSAIKIKLWIKNGTPAVKSTPFIV